MIRRRRVTDERLGELIHKVDTLEKPHIEELRAILLELRELRAKTSSTDAAETNLRLAAALEQCRATAEAALAEAAAR